MDANRKIIVATGNEGKMNEIRQILGNENITFSSLKDEKLQDVEIIENGKTFEENAIIKARTISDLTGKMVLADDSGLEIDYLDKAPGVYSARFAGEEHNDAKNNEKLLKLLKNVTGDDRKAKFVSVITLVYPDGKTLVARGECQGRIIGAPTGENGFGYDPLFVPDGCNKTFAQLTEEEKNAISHRARALEKLEGLLSDR